jgi:hypothetical protein
MGIPYKNRKNGEIYWLLAHATDQTDNFGGRGMIVYCPADQGNTIHVREESEFHQKFSRCADSSMPEDVSDV